VPNRFVRLVVFLKSIWLARQKHSEPASTITTCHDSAILSETCSLARKSRQLVADTSEPVRNLSETCSLARASGPDSIVDFGLYSLKSANFSYPLSFDALEWLEWRDLTSLRWAKYIVERTPRVTISLSCCVSIVQNNVACCRQCTQFNPSFHANAINSCLTSVV